MSFQNRKTQLLKTLKSIESYNKFDNLNIIIVDDCSNSDQRLEGIVDNYNFNIVLLRVDPERKNWYNPCVTYNYGFMHLEAADNDVIIIQNPECVHNGDILSYSLDNTTDLNYLVYHCASLDKKQTKDYIASSKFQSTDTPDRASDAGSYDGNVTWYTHSKFRPKYYHFCSSLTYKNLKLLNGFDLDFRFGHAFDDDDFAMRVCRLGLKNKFVPDPYVYHLWHNRSFNKRLLDNLHYNKRLFEDKEQNTTNYTANPGTFFGKKIK